MRLWSLHPKYLDRIGLVACWREALLAQAVLLGKTRGYKNHPQLDRFKQYSDSIQKIGVYLNYIWREAEIRGYRFDEMKISDTTMCGTEPHMTVTLGQFHYECEHLIKKMEERSPDCKQLENLKTEWFHNYAIPHPLFRFIHGPIEP